MAIQATMSDSFDPRTWVDAGTLVGVARSAPDSRFPAGRAMPLAIAASAAILALGAVGAWVTRGDGNGANGAASGPATVAAATPLGAEEAERTLVLASLDELPGVLTGAGLGQAAAAAVTATAKAGLPGTGEVRAMLRLSTANDAPTLVRLELSHPDGSGIMIVPDGADRYASSPLAANLTARVIVRSGRMDADSFYSSAVAAGITDSLIPAFAKALAFDFDFQREVTAGDAFEAAFKQNFNAQGDPVGAPTLLYASLTTQTKSATVYHYDGGSDGEWFDGSGRSVVRSLMRTPVDGARVSSTFGVRVHPVLGYQKMHEGIDFAVPTGTPIFASGNAQVIWSGMKGANGNLVVLKHDDGRETWYLHQSRIMPEVVVGARVIQGQKIGEVGTTGRSTGPHLHYGMKVDGAWVDPSSVPVDEGKTLSGAGLIAFGKVRDEIDASRANPTG